MLVCLLVGWFPQVLDQFLSTSGASSSPEEVSESYLVGNRLVKFLSVVLPTHKEYFSNDPELIQCRVRSQEQLIDLLQYMEELALIVDEIQYNLYILQDLKPAKKSNSGDWTESTANDTSMESMASEMSTQNHFEQRIAAVVSASETKPSKLAKPEPKTFTPSKRPQQNFQDMSFEDDLFGGSDDFDDDFDIRSNDFSFQADFSSFGNNNDDYWFSKAQGSQHRADWFAESQNTSYNSHNTSFTTPTSNRYTTTAQSAPGRSNGFNTTPTRIPKMKPPRSAPPRELMQQSFPTEFDVPPPSTTTNTPASPNRKASLLDDDTLPAPKSKIEERLEQAERMQKDFNNMESVNRRQPREEALTVTTNKRLLHHFKGCVRFLGD